MSTPLQPCPFCGCDNISNPRVKDGRAWVKCVRCEVLGPCRESPEAAIMAWNTRADVGQFAKLISGKGAVIIK